METIKILFTSDMHASRRCWRRFVDYSVHHDVDFAVVGGDLAGKRIAPIRTHGAGIFSSDISASTRRFGESEIRKVERELSNEGLYPVLVSDGELQRLKVNPGDVDRSFISLMKERLEQWAWDATSRFRNRKTKLLLMPGNDDPWEIDKTISDLAIRGANVYNPENCPVENGLGGFFYGLSWVNETPFCCERDKPDHLIAEELAKRFSSESPAVLENSIFVFHCPPFDSGLDIAPKLDESKRPLVKGGVIINAPCGSMAVRDAILQLRPLLSLHGHIHESPGRTSLGRTECYNPGSMYNMGVFCGYLIELTTKGVASWLRIQD